MKPSNEQALAECKSTYEAEGRSFFYSTEEDVWCAYESIQKEKEIKPHIRIKEYHVGGLTIKETHLVDEEESAVP